MQTWWKRSRFFFVSLVIHFTIVAILAVWTLPTVIHIIVTKVHEADAGSQPFDDSQHQSNERGLEQWEKLSDYKGEQQNVQHIPRQTTEPHHVPPNTAVMGQMQATVADRTVPSRKVFIIPQRQPVVSIRNEPLLPRDTRTQPAAFETNETVNRTRPTPQPELLTEEPTLDEIDRANNRLPSPKAPTPIADRKEPQPKTIQSQKSETKPKIISRERGPTRKLDVAAVEITNDKSVPFRPLKKKVDLVKTQDTPLPRRSNRSGAPPTKSVAALPSVTQPAPRKLKSSATNPTPTIKKATAISQIGRARPAPAALPFSQVDNSKPTTIEKAVKAAPGPTPVVKALPRRRIPVRFQSRIVTDSVTGRPKPVSIGVLSTVSNNAPPKAGKFASRLTRPHAKARPVTYAEDSVGMQQMFVLRQADVRRQYIELFGGTKASEKAVEQGLNWIATHQHPDGRWCLNRFHENCKRCKHPNCAGAGTTRSDTAGTALGLLPLLGAGNTHQNGKYKANVAKGWLWLKKIQKKNGDLLSPGDAQHMYSHCLATIALCELYGMSKDPAIKDSAQRAIQFVVTARHKPTGGWRYTPGQPADTSVVGWAVMALKSAEMAGLKVPADALTGAAKWLKSVEGNGKVGGTFGYQNRSANRTMTAEGLLCLQFLGVKRNTVRMRAGADYLLANMPGTAQNSSNTSYFWYYGTQVMYHMQGHYWKRWNVKLRDQLVKSQVKSAGLAGTWSPSDNWETSGGRLYATSIKLLILEVYYRHLPLYEQLDE